MRYDIFFIETEKLELDLLAQASETRLDECCRLQNTSNSVKKSSSSSFSSPKPSPNTPKLLLHYHWPPQAIFACRRITARRRTVWSKQNLQNSTRGFGRERSLQSFLRGFFEVTVILSLLIISLSLSLYLFWLGNYYWMFLHFLWKTL